MRHDISTPPGTARTARPPGKPGINWNELVDCGEEGPEIPPWPLPTAYFFDKASLGAEIAAQQAEPPQQGLPEAAATLEKLGFPTSILPQATARLE